MTVPADELLLQAVVAEHLRGAGRRRLVRLAASAPAYGIGPSASRPRPADLWDTALSDYVRAAASA
jgi:hypothetical protein